MFRKIIRKSAKYVYDMVGGSEKSEQPLPPPAPPPVIIPTEPIPEPITYGMQELLNHNYVKMMKTKEYEADDHGGMLCWSYRFTFDNGSRKRQFMKALEAYPPQEWDKWVCWFDDISNYNKEICAEARCMVPPNESGKFRYKFEQFVTNDLVLKE